MASRNSAADAEALRLRLVGYTYDQIALRQGYANKSVAFKAVGRALAAGAEPEGVALEIQRLDMLQQGLFWKAVEGDVPAALAVVKIIEQRAKLSGLVKPAVAASEPARSAPVEPKDPVDDITARIAARRASAGS